MKRRVFWLLAACMAVAANGVAAESLQSKLRAIAGPSSVTEPEVPDPEQVFRLNLGAADGGTLLLIDIDDCCYLYRDKIKIELVGANGSTAPSGSRLGAYTLPPGKAKLDEFIGRTEVYRQPIEIRIPIQTNVPIAGLALKVSYQGCAEKPVAICYEPMTKVLALDGGDITPTTQGAATFWLALAAAFGAGLLLSFTPCVLPMIPILSGIIVGAEGKRLTKLRGGLLSYIYVLGTAVTYTTAGALAGATGEQLQAYFQNPWAIGVFSAVLVLLALSMFGLYQLQVPAFIQSLLHTHSSNLHRRTKRSVTGEYIGVFILGLLSALIVGACVSPVLISVLGVAVATHDPWLGAGVMFLLAHGQGAILIAVGVGESAFLPKAGAWMDTVKHVFGVLLLGVAIYLLGFLPQVPVLLLWGALFIVCAVYLGATQRLPEGANGWRYLWKGLGTALLIWGVLALIGGFVGNRDIFDPLPRTWLRDTSAPTEKKTAFERITTMAQLDQRLAEAKASAKPVLLDYYADWCTDCVRMEKGSFADPTVRAQLAGRFVTVQVDVTNNDDPQIKALKRRFSVYGPPATLFFSSTGVELTELRTYGYIERDNFLAMLRRVN